MLGVPKALWALFAAMALLFVLFPQIDVAFASLFYDPQAGFVHAHNPLVLFFYRWGPKLVVIAAVVALLILLADFIFRRHFFSFKPLALLYLSLVMTLGPGIIVHSVFKDHWGRARPAQTDLFGATKQFSPAFVMTDQCDRNCSFVSGHAAAAFALIALGFVVPRRKALTFALGGAYGAAVGFGRILQGDHFLSDVLFAFVFVYLTARILYYYLYEKRVLPFRFLEEPSER